MTVRKLTTKQRRALIGAMENDSSINKGSQSYQEYELAKQRYLGNQNLNPGQYGQQITVIADFLNV